MTRRERKQSRKGTKRALTSSVLAIALCVVLLAGATFAWFTDTASTKISDIKSGTLKVGLTNANGSELSANDLSFKANGSNGSRESILWEPGATYRTEGFKVKNTGALALEYKLYITLPEKTDTDAKELLDAIDFSVVKQDGENYVEVSPAAFAEGLKETNSASEVYYIQGHMREGAGNQYQGKTLSGVSVLVLATQYPEEYDSYTNKYDAAADLPETIDLVISSADGLSSFAKRVNGGETFEGQTVVLTQDIELSGNFTPIGKKDGNSFKGTFDGLGYTISGLSIENGNYTGLFGQIENAVIRNLTVKGSVSGTDMAGLCGKGLRSITVENVTVDVTVNGTDKAAGFFAGLNSEDASNDVVFTNCVNLGDVTGTTYAAGLVGWFGAKGNYTFTNCKNTGDMTISTTSSATEAFAGGMIAYCNGTASYTGKLVNCENTGSMVNPSTGASASTGGLLGHADTEGTSLVVTDCKNSGVVSGRIAGGLIGETNCTLTITNASNTGSVTNGDATLTGKNNVVGGIVGLARNATGASTLESCVNTGIVRLNVGTLTVSSSTTEALAAGGIVGNIGSSSASSAYTLTSCTNSGDVSAAGTVTANQFGMSLCAGGIAGYVQGSGSVTISNPTTTGSVKLTNNNSQTYYGLAVGHCYQGTLSITDVSSTKDTTDADGIGVIGAGSFTKS